MKKQSESQKRNSSSGAEIQRQNAGPNSEGNPPKLSTREASSDEQGREGQTPILTFQQGEKLLAAVDELSNAVLRAYGLLNILGAQHEDYLLATEASAFELAQAAALNFIAGDVAELLQSALDDTVQELKRLRSTTHDGKPANPAL